VHGASIAGCALVGGAALLLPLLSPYRAYTTARSLHRLRRHVGGEAAARAEGGGGGAGLKLSEEAKELSTIAGVQLERAAHAAGTDGGDGGDGRGGGEPLAVPPVRRGLGAASFKVTGVGAEGGAAVAAKRAKWAAVRARVGVGGGVAGGARRPLAEASSLRTLAGLLKGLTAEQERHGDDGGGGDHARTHSLHKMVSAHQHALRAQYARADGGGGGGGGGAYAAGPDGEGADDGAAEATTAAKQPPPPVEGGARAALELFQSGTKPKEEAQAALPSGVLRRLLVLAGLVEALADLRAGLQRLLNIFGAPPPPARLPPACPPPRPARGWATVELWRAPCVTVRDRAAGKEALDDLGPRRSAAFALFFLLYPLLWFGVLGEGGVGCSRAPASSAAPNASEAAAPPPPSASLAVIEKECGLGFYWHVPWLMVLWLGLGLFGCVVWLLLGYWKNLPSMYDCPRMTRDGALRANSANRMALLSM
jgi:hypothetical protein